MSAPTELADVYSVLAGAPGVLAGRGDSLIAYALDAGIADRPRVEVLHRWHDQGTGGDTDLAVGLVVAQDGGTAIWIEPDTTGASVLAVTPDGRRVVGADELAAAVTGSIEAPGRGASTLATTPAGEAVTEGSADLARAAIAAMAVGTATRALRAAIDHASGREQFGKPVGVFQAVSHRLARCFRDLVAAQELLTRADDEPTPVLLALARHRALAAAADAVGAAVQTCGASGFRIDSAVGSAFRQVQQDRIAARLQPYELAAVREPLKNSIAAIRTSRAGIA